MKQLITFGFPPFFCFADLASPPRAQLIHQMPADDVGTLGLGGYPDGSSCSFFEILWESISMIASRIYIDRNQGYPNRNSLGVWFIVTYLYLYMYIYVYGWWLSHHSEKIYESQFGNILPNGKKQKHMFQISNQATCFQDAFLDDFHLFSSNSFQMSEVSQIFLTFLVNFLSGEGQKFFKLQGFDREASVVSQKNISRLPAKSIEWHR